MTNKRGLTGIFVLFVLAILSACGKGSTPGPAAAAITAQPTDQSVVAGTTATFTVVASNATGYQWQRSTDGGTTFVAVNGATSASHTTPVTTLADNGTRYRVVVSGASNSVNSSAATLMVAAVTSWSTPTMIGGANANQAAVGASSDGYVIISWIQYDSLDQQYNAYAKFYHSAAGAWGNDRLIENLTTNPQATGYLAMGAYSPRVAVSRNGRGTVLFGYALPPASYGLRIVRHSPGGVGDPVGFETWSDPETINTTGNNVAAHALAVLGDQQNSERHMSVYSQHDTDTTVSGAPKYRIFGQSYDIPCMGPVCTGPSSILQSATMIERSPGDAGNVALSRLGNDGIAVWTQQHPSQNAIWASRYDYSAATWSTPQQLNPGSTSSAYPATVAGNEAGQAIAAWLELEPVSGQYRLFASRLDASGWSAPVRLDTAGIDGSVINISNDAPSASVAIDAGGNVVVAWAQNETNNGFSSVLTRRCTAATALNACAAATAFVKPFVQSAYSPKVASLPNGDFWAVWKQDNALFEPRVYASRYLNSTSQWDAPALLGGSYVGGHLEIAVDGQGRATVVWDDGGDNRVYFTRNE